MRMVATRLPITLVIPAHESEATIATAIASAVRAAFVPAEIIVVDDGSNDRSAAIAAAAGSRVLRIAAPSGPVAARNAGAAAANEPWIAFLEPNEVWLDGKLAAQWVAICRWPDAALCFTDYDAVDVRGRTIANALRSRPGHALLEASERSADAVRYERDGFVRALARSVIVERSSIVVNRALFERSGGFEPALASVADLDLLWRLAAAAPVIAIERALVSCAHRPAAWPQRSAEVDARERLWAAVLRDPQRYPAAVADLVRRDPAAPLRHGGASALRAGHLAEAAAFALRALTGTRDSRFSKDHLAHDRSDGGTGGAGEPERVPFGRHQ